jgi:predicted nucleotidyltransferase
VQSPVADLRERADTIAQSLAREPAVDGICLFGSIARGDATPSSDIDLLVVGSDPDLSPTKLLKLLPEPLRRQRISLVYYPDDDLEQLFTSGSSFVDHLRREATILYDEDGRLGQVLGDEFTVHLDISAELAAELDRLSIYSDLRMFNGNLLFVLAQLYAIGKAIVMLALTAAGEREYNREAAFAAFRRSQPELASELEAIECLRPFYRLVTRRGSEPLPFPYRDAEANTRTAIDAIRRIAGAVEQSL